MKRNADEVFDDNPTQTKKLDKGEEDNDMDAENVQSESSLSGSTNNLGSLGVIKKSNSNSDKQNGVGNIDGINQENKSGSMVDNNKKGNNTTVKLIVKPGGGYTTATVLRASMPPKNPSNTTPVLVGVGSSVATASDINSNLEEESSKSTSEEAESKNKLLSNRPSNNEEDSGSEEPQSKNSSKSNNVDNLKKNNDGQPQDLDSIMQEEEENNTSSANPSVVTASEGKFNSTKKSSIDSGESTTKSDMSVKKEHKDGANATVDVKVENSNFKESNNKSKGTRNEISSGDGKVDNSSNNGNAGVVGITATAGGVTSLQMGAPITAAGGPMPDGASGDVVVGGGGMTALGFPPNNGAGGSIPGYPGGTNFIPMTRQLGVEDALAYLDKVKRQFHDRLEVYNQFLEIMKNFKSHNIDTPGVINHVCELFKGHDNLILGFNTFLPPGFKIELPNRALGPTVGGRPIITQGLTLAQQQQLMQQQIAHNRLKNQQRQQINAAGNQSSGAVVSGQGRGGGKASGRQSPNSNNNAASPIGVQNPMTQTLAMLNDPSAGLSAFVAQHSGGVNGTAVSPNVLDDNTAAANVEGQPMEFDHAINYVTKIKKRFSAETDTYKTFLDILHSYQNEQRSIKEVLEQVSNLFKDHSDLLKEFTYFLPDAVRESAKHELVKRAAKAKARDRRLAKQNAKSGRGNKNTVPTSDVDNFGETKIPQLERNILGRIKAAIGSRELWGEFLKCLDLFAQELISRAELLALISDIFGERSDLLEEFDRLLASRGATDDPVESAWFSMPLTDIDFSNCRRCTPSYRALPAAYPKAPCSERTAMCRSVLNDTWVSVPLGSEDSNGRNQRRNQYQEALFKCEDDRYEVDIIMESNKSAIRALEPLAREIEALNAENGPGSKFRYRLEKRTLSVIHLKAISRIYGEHGTEILELLRRNPAGAIPVILKRLKEKDFEWSNDRLELNKGWKDVMARNYTKSLDHRSYYFKQAEKRAYNQKTLLTELKEKKEAALSKSSSPTNSSVAIDNNNNDKSSKKELDDMYSKNDHLILNFPNAAIHQIIWGLISMKVNKFSDAKEAEKAAAFYAFFIHPLFQMPKKWLKDNQPLTQSLLAGNVFDSSNNEKPKTRKDALPDGSHVSTPYGLGVVQDYRPEHGIYKVALSFGISYIGAQMVNEDTTAMEAMKEGMPILKPLRPIVANDIEADKQASSYHEEPKTFYATSALYIFLRQYHIFYDRLFQVWQLCKNARQKYPRTVKHIVDRVHEETAVNALKNAMSKVVASAKNESKNNDMEVDETVTEENDYDHKIKNDDNDEADEFTILLALITAHIGGQVESAKFEDEVRNLIGPDGYIIFTIDKLVQAIHKQLGSILADSGSKACLDSLQVYVENESPSADELADVFQKFNQHILQQDGTCFRFRFYPGSLNENSDEEKNHWINPPRIGIALTDEMPSIELSNNNETPSILLPCPISIDYQNNLSIENIRSTFNFDLNKIKVANKSSYDMELGIYQFVSIPVSKELEKLVKEYSDQVIESKVPGSTNLFISHVKSSATSDILQNTNDKDVKME